MTALELQEIIECCITNNRIGQEKLYKYYYAEMYRTCQRYTDDAHEAMTILNDAFLKAFRNITQFNNTIGSFTPWLKTIVINTAIDHVRACKTKPGFVQIDQAAEVGSNDFQLIFNWKQEELVHHFKQLPNITRVVLNLFAFDGYTHKDIAGHLNITETTSRWHLAEARKKLKLSMQLKTHKTAKYE